MKASPPIPSPEHTPAVQQAARRLADLQVRLSQAVEATGEAERRYARLEANAATALRQGTAPPALDRAQADVWTSHPKCRLLALAWWGETAAGGAPTWLTAPDRPPATRRAGCGCKSDSGSAGASSLLYLLIYVNTSIR
jgi:hypothetical protein